MKPILAMVLIGISLSACATGSGTEAKRAGGPGLSEDQKHRLYSAALAASESPLDSELFKDVCRKLGIFDANGQPNETYMAFVARHVEWGMKSENGQFRREIDTREKARDYIHKHSP
jgi:hypothetical protein